MSSIFIIFKNKLWFTLLFFATSLFANSLSIITNTNTNTNTNNTINVDIISLTLAMDLINKKTTRGNICETPFLPLKSKECTLISKYPFEVMTGSTNNKNLISSLCQIDPKVYNLGLENLNVCNESNDRFDSTYTHPSENENRKKGLVSLTGNQLNSMDEKTKEKLINIKSALFNMAKEVQTELAKQCCGVENKKCKDRLLNIGISMCKSPHNSTEKDFCSEGTSYFIFNTFGDQVSAIAQLRKLLVSIQKNELNKTEFDIIIEKFKTELNHDEKQWDSVIKKFTDIPPGYINISPYVNIQDMEGTLKKARTVFTHEFSHGCDRILNEQQVSNYKNNSNAFYALTSAIQSYGLETKCKLANSHKNYYRNLWQSLGESINLAICFEKITEETKNKESKSYCPNACASDFFAESFAMGYEMLSFKEEFQPNFYPDRICHGVQDSKHPRSSDILECLAQHSPRFRQRFRDVFSCN